MTTCSLWEPIGEPFLYLSHISFVEKILGAQFTSLKIQNRITQGFKYTKKSAANVISGIRQYLYFTLYFKIEPEQASEETLVCFLEFMARSSSYSHLKHLLSSVKFLHSALNLKFPDKSFQIDITLQGLKRRLANVPFQEVDCCILLTIEVFQSRNFSGQMEAKESY